MCFTATLLKWTVSIAIGNPSVYSVEKYYIDKASGGRDWGMSSAPPPPPKKKKKEKNYKVQTHVSPCPQSDLASTTIHT